MRLRDLAHAVLIDPRKLTVTAMTKPELYDTVELLVDLPEYRLNAGARGALVHQHAQDVFEVEFTDEDGQTLALCPLNTVQFMVIWRHATQMWVSADEQAADIVSRLHEPDRREVLDFARYLHARRAQNRLERVSQP